MLTKIILTITEGELKGQEFVFDSRTTCIIGRAKDCNLQLPSNEAHLNISRHHCLLDINPPTIRVRDLSSKIGTYVNDVNIGERSLHQTSEPGGKLKLPGYYLRAGDRIKIGNTVFTVNIKVNSKFVNIPNSIQTAANTQHQSIQPPNSLEEMRFWFGLAKSANNHLESIQDYSIIKLLGKGSFGDVYLAQHNSDSRFLALKLISPAYAADSGMVQRFLTEMEKIKALQHPNIAQLVDFGFYDGIFFVAMEYCFRGTVKDLMQQQGGKLPIDTAVPIVLQILDGLEYSHSTKGLLHNDLKLSNILLKHRNGKMRAKIGDYGIAGALEQVGLSNIRSRTYFMPRQQPIDFKYAKPEVDIWAIAACLYSMLTDAYPHPFTSDPRLTVLQTDCVPIRDRDPEVPKKLAELIDLALVDKPETYFKDVVAFKNALYEAYLWGKTRLYLNKAPLKKGGWGVKDKAS